MRAIQQNTSEYGQATSGQGTAANGDQETMTDHFRSPQGQIKVNDEPPQRLVQRRKEARPVELIDAALDIFVKKGFAATRLDDVAARAGVSKGTIKETLFKAVIESALNAGRIGSRHDGTQVNGRTAASEGSNDGLGSRLRENVKIE